MKRDSLFDAVMVFKKKNRKANHFPGDGLFSGAKKAEAYKEYCLVWNSVDHQIKHSESAKLPASFTPAFNHSASTPSKQSSEEASTPPLRTLRSSEKRQGCPPLTGQDVVRLYLKTNTIIGSAKTMQTKYIERKLAERLVVLLRSVGEVLVAA